MTIFVIDIDCEYSKYSIPVIQNFCSFNKVNLFILKSNIKQNIYGKHPSWLKLFSHDLVNDDFILCWDLDLLPIKNFKLDFLDLAKINLAHDSGFLKDGFTFNGKFKYNCGLIGIPKKYSDLFKNIYFNQAANSNYPSYEQYHINDLIHDKSIDINLIDNKYNYLFDGNSIPDEVQSIHYTWKINSQNHRVDLIKAHFEKYMKIF